MLILFLLEEQGARHEQVEISAGDAERAKAEYWLEDTTTAFAATQEEDCTEVVGLNKEADRKDADYAKKNVIKLEAVQHSPEAPMEEEEEMAVWTHIFAVCLYAVKDAEAQIGLENITAIEVLTVEDTSGQASLNGDISNDVFCTLAVDEVIPSQDTPVKLFPSQDVTEEVYTDWDPITEWLLRPKVVSAVSKEKEYLFPKDVKVSEPVPIGSLIEEVPVSPPAEAKQENVKEAALDDVPEKVGEIVLETSKFSVPDSLSFLTEKVPPYKGNSGLEVSTAAELNNEESGNVC